MQGSKSVLIIALDNLETLEQSDPYRLIEELSGEGISWFKVGLELYSSQGPKIVEFIKSKNLKAFVDLKLFDIPNTVFRATKSISNLGADLLTVHAFGGCEMLSSAKEGSRGTSLKVIGVTLLTSFGTNDINHLANHFKATTSREHIVTNLANDVEVSKLDGVVCSVSDLQKIKPIFTNHQTPVFLTPGIRLKEDSSNDQKNIATPKQAVKSGSTHLVVGRSILSVTEKLRSEKIKHYLKELESAHVE